MKCGFTVTVIFIIIIIVFGSLAAFDEIWLFVSCKKGQVTKTIEAHINIKTFLLHKLYAIDAGKLNFLPHSVLLLNISVRLVLSPFLYFQLKSHMENN